MIAGDTLNGQGEWRETIATYATWFAKIFHSVSGFILVLGQAPSMVKNLTFMVGVLGLMDMAHYSSTGLWLHNNLSKKPVYGPPYVPPVAPKKFYSFEKVGRSFRLKFPLWRIGEISQEELHEMISSSTPDHLKEGLESHIDLAFHYAQVYQLDPFWVLSIIWVESHFDPTVKSPVKASGLMQIMPATSFWLNHLLERSLYPKLAYELTEDPNHNVQLGTFYLKRLLNTFKGNYIHATVAYNMGPGYTKRRLRWGLAVGTKNLYLEKVRKAYDLMTSKIKIHMKEHWPRFHDTYVIQRRLAFESREIEFVSWWELGLPKDDLALNESPLLKDKVF